MDDIVQIQKYREDGTMLVSARIESQENKVIITNRATQETIDILEFDTEKEAQVAKCHLWNIKLANAATTRQWAHCAMIDPGNGKKIKTGWIR